MLINLFKKKITEQEAAAHSVRYILTETQSSWEQIHKTFVDTFKEKFIVIDNQMASFDLTLAAIAQDLETLKNLFSSDRAIRIEKWILKCIDTEDWGEYAIQEVNEYRKIFQHSVENIENGDNPINAIPSRLLSKWLGQGLQNFEIEISGIKTGTISPVLLLMTASVLIGFSGNWKKTKENYKIIVGDLPLDYKNSPFHDLVEDETKPDGTIKYYDNNGNLKEKWLPPEQLEKILKHPGTKKVYKVLIKGPWEGIKVDMWELDENTVNNFVDTNGLAYAICAYEKGEPKIHI